MIITPFYVGQKITYIGNSNSWYDNDGNPEPGPKREESLTVMRSYIEPATGLWAIDLKEYPPKSSDDGYVCETIDHQMLFVPIIEAKFPLISYSRVMEEVLVGEN